MFGLGLPEIAIILGIIFLLFGAKRIPEIGSAIGKTVTEIRKIRDERKSDREKEKGGEKGAEAEKEAEKGTSLFFSKPGTVGRLVAGRSEKIGMSPFSRVNCSAQDSA